MLKIVIYKHCLIKYQTQTAKETIKKRKNT